MLEIFIEQYGKLIADCLIIAIETIGLVKFFDNFIFPKRSLKLREKCGMEFIICIICAFINSVFVPEGISEVCNLFLLALAITQLCYDGIIHGVPKFLNKLFKISENEEDEDTTIKRKPKNKEEYIGK